MRRMENRTYADNDEAILAWNTVLFDKFCRFRETLVRGLGPHGGALLDRHPPAEGTRVLDVGCGFGDSTIDIARRVGPKGEAVGIDAAPRFIETATKDAQHACGTQARICVADHSRESIGR